jgi:hypothetical protein
VSKFGRHCGRSITDADFLQRWAYLEAGISKIMIDLQSGIDMNTVSEHPGLARNALTLWAVHGRLYVRTGDPYEVGTY